MQYAWFIWSLIGLGIWLMIYLARYSYRREMLHISLATMFFGLTEPLFVPQYWNPPSLFDLAQQTGFDIESFIFSFSIGGIGHSLYYFVYPVKMIEMGGSERQHRRHRLHYYLLLSPAMIFLFLAVFTKLNHIYCGVISLFAGALATLYCRSDLKVKLWAGGTLFLSLYFIYFDSLLLFFPDFVSQHWNLEALTGILILGIPLEELLFAFSFGMYWSSLYEHFTWRKLIR
jgi:hypothetical protein